MLELETERTLVQQVDALLERYSEGERSRALAWILARDVSPHVTPAEILTVWRLGDLPDAESTPTIEVHEARADGSRTR